MACTLTRGLLVDCKDQIGGLKKIWFCKNYAGNVRGKATIASNEMTSGGFATWDSNEGGKVILFQYDLRPNLSSLTVNVNSAPSAGTTFFTQNLSVTLQKLTKDQSNEIKLIAYNRVQIFVQDMNDNVFLLGMDNGVDVTGGTIVTGAGKADMSGYTLELSAEEKEPMIWLAATAGPSTAVYPFDGLGDEADLTITVGT
jgi:hypothetical protein